MLAPRPSIRSGRLLGGAQVPTPRPPGVTNVCRLCPLLLVWRLLRLPMLLMLVPLMLLLLLLLRRGWVRRQTVPR